VGAGNGGGGGWGGRGGGTSWVDARGDTDVCFWGFGSVDYAGGVLATFGEGEGEI